MKPLLCWPLLTVGISWEWVSRSANWKIGILTGTVTQNEEEYRMAEQMQAEFGADRVIIATYPDRFMQEQGNHHQQHAGNGCRP